MGNASSMLTQYDIEEVQDYCNYLLSEQEIVSLYQRFCELDRNAKGYISADEMLSVPEFAMNPLSKLYLQRVVEMVDGFNFKDFVVIFSAFTSKANQQQKPQPSPDPTFERSRLHSRDSYLMFHCIVMVIFIVLSVTCIILYRFSGDVEAPVK